MTPLDKIKVQRHPERGVYDRDVIDKILDSAFVCHVGFVHEGRPVVIPTAYGREGNRVFIHGSNASRMLRILAKEIEMCLTVTILDGMVLARSAFNHSLNYRSVVIFGKAELVSPSEKLHALRVISDNVLKGRWEDVRPPTIKELDLTTVLSIPIEQASAKIRSGPPKDDDDDYGLDVWAGVIPLNLASGRPIVDPASKKTLPEPPYLKKVFEDPQFP